MRIAFVASEANPYVKTGGLADVAAALPKVLARRGHDVALIMPRYGLHAVVERAQPLELWVPVPFDYRTDYAQIYHDPEAEVPTFFVDNPRYFVRDSKGPYGESDDPERFAWFCRAACETIRRLGDPPDIVQCNDWMTGLVPAHMHATFASDPYWTATGSLLTIHNLAFQGLFDPADIGKYGFPPDTYQTEGGFEFHGSASMLKAAILSADMVSTVSPRYAQEIQTPEFGFKMDGLLRARSRDLVGILNGVDYENWDPVHDPYIAAHFSVDDIEGKQTCKRDLLNRFGLPVEMRRPVFGIVSRLSDQKGIDLVAQSVLRLVEAGAYFVQLGSGASEYENLFQRLRDTWPHLIGTYRGYNDPLAHAIEAGADFFLMPSRFEPCGLNQIYSLRYGTVPVVRATGGLDDTIQHFDRASRSGNGFKFYEYRADRLIETIYEGLLVYRQQELWTTLQRNGMLADFSWDRSATEYEALFAEILSRKARRLG
jgi:starch synthase